MLGLLEGCSPPGANRSCLARLTPPVPVEEDVPATFPHCNTKYYKYVKISYYYTCVINVIRTMIIRKISGPELEEHHHRYRECLVPSGCRRSAVKIPPFLSFGSWRECPTISSQQSFKSDRSRYWKVFYFARGVSARRCCRINSYHSINMDLEYR